MMSEMPNNMKSKYNHDNKFLWVDVQLEKFMVRQKKLEQRVKELEEENKNLKVYFNIDTNEEKNQLDLFPPKS
jgi:hypothetical protein